jgi:hypothetical protein
MKKQTDSPQGAASGGRPTPVQVAAAQRRIGLNFTGCAPGAGASQFEN